VYVIARGGNTLNTHDRINRPPHNLYAGAGSSKPNAIQLFIHSEALWALWLKGFFEAVNSPAPFCDYRQVQDCLSDTRFRSLRQSNPLL